MLEIFSGLGVIILLFEVGLESEFNEMMSVGAKVTYSSYSRS